MICSQYLGLKASENSSHPVDCKFCCTRFLFVELIAEALECTGRKFSKQIDITKDQRSQVKSRTRSSRD